mgnify:FL=1
MFTLDEVKALDASSIDSVTADKLIATAVQLFGNVEFLNRNHAWFVHQTVALWCADQQGELLEAAQWAIGDVECWLDADEIASDPWAHDWREFWRSRSQFQDGPTAPCFCGRPATIHNKNWNACSDRHRLAILGRLLDERCAVCGETKICAYDTSTGDAPGHPVCADCWPGQRVLAERRAAWSARVLGSTEVDA